MKKALIFFITFLLLICNTSSIYADDCEDECNGDNASKSACKVCKEKAARDRYDEIQNQISAASKDLDEAASLANEYSDKIEVLENEIAILQPDIDALQVRIDDLTNKIEENGKKVDEINNRVLNRMAKSQSSMHFNPILDFLLGSSGFSDFLRRSYGLDAIMGREEEDKNDLIDIIEQLNKDKAECDAAKFELDTKKKDIESKKQEAALMKQFYDQVKIEIEAEIDKLIEESNKQQMIISSIVWELDDLLARPRQTGFIHPVSSARISAGMPNYPASFGGGKHIGIDYAASYDTPILAPADGVVISSINTCSLDTGSHLGNRCPENPSGKGMSAGGNQVRMMCSVNGIIYGLIFFHMKQYDVHQEGVVMAGSMIGRVGSSGNSTGAHCHIELFYLGEGEADKIPEYLNKGYTVGFNLPYDQSSLCDRRTGSPCRLDGRLYFGVDPATLNRGLYS